MRLSMPTMIVFAAHTATHVIAAPLPFSGDVQDLEIRGKDDDTPASSGNPHASSSGNSLASSSGITRLWRIGPDLQRVSLIRFHPHW